MLLLDYIVKNYELGWANPTRGYLKIKVSSVFSKSDFDNWMSYQFY